MRLDQANNASADFDYFSGVGQDFVLPRPACIDRDQIHRFWDRDVHRIGSLENDNALILAELPGEGAIGGVHRVHSVGAPLKQAIDEAADMASQVGANRPFDVHTKRIQGRSELVSSS